MDWQEWLAGIALIVLTLAAGVWWQVSGAGEPLDEGYCRDHPIECSGDEYDPPGPVGP